MADDPGNTNIAEAGKPVSPFWIPGSRNDFDSFIVGLADAIDPSAGGRWVAHDSGYSFLA